eukprot:352664-Chlamydomonas_euryale.AAC.7
MRSISSGSRALFDTRATDPSSPIEMPSPSMMPSPSSCALRRAISSWNSRSIASLGSSFTRGLFLMFFARLAYRSVDSVSS